MTSSSSGWTDLVREADRVRESLHFRGDTDEADLIGALRDELRAEKKDCEIIANALDEERAYSAHLRDEVARVKEWHGIGVATRFMQGVEARRWAEWLAAEKEYYRKKCDAMEQDWIELEEDARLGFASRMQMHGISDELNATRAERDAARRWAEWFAAEREHYKRSRVVKTVTELDALPERTIIRDADGDSMHKLYRPGGDTRWYCSRYDHRESDPVNLPATILWTPETGDIE